MKKHNVFFNHSTGHVIELRRTLESMESSLDFDGNQMQVFHDSLPLEDGNQEVVDNWIAAGRSITSIPLYGRTSSTLVSSKPLTGPNDAVLIGSLVTIDPELAEAFVKRIDTFLRYGAMEAVMYKNLLDYAMYVPMDLVSVSDPSDTQLNQVFEAANAINAYDVKETEKCWVALVYCFDNERWVDAIKEVTAKVKGTNLAKAISRLTHPDK